MAGSKTIKDGLLALMMLGSDYFPEARKVQSRAKDPAMWSPYSATKHVTAPNEFVVKGRKNVGLLESPDLIKPEDIMGKTLYFPTGDRTSNQFIVDEINDYLLSNKPTTYGGPEYKDQIGRGVWASEPTAMRAKQKVWNEMADREDILTAYMPMGERSGDFSKHMAEVYADMLRSSPIGHNSSFMIDDMLKARFPKDNIPSFGDREQFAKWLVGQKGGKRSQIIKYFDSNAMKEMGVPDVSAARFAVTNPDLVNSEALSVGYRFGVPDAAAEMVKSKDHPSYGAYVPRKEGTKSMTLGAELPWIIGARDSALPKAAAGKITPMPKDIKSYMGNPRLSQLVDQQWVDEASTWQERLRSGGKEAADYYTRSLLDAFIKKGS